jgi:long-subunit fatty acid transport protein
MGRGGTNLGFADNAAVILDNPAAMTNVAGTGLFEAGVDTVICSVDYSDPDNPNAPNSVNGYPLPMVGYIHRNPDSCWAYGIGAYAPAGFGAGFHLDNPHTGPARYKSLGALAKVLPGVACQVTDRLSVGATLGLAFSHVELEGPFYTQTGPFAGAPSLLDLQSTGVAPTGTLGLQYQLTNTTMVGVAYTEESRFVFDGNASAQFLTPYGALSSEFDAETDIVWPRSLGIGVKQDIGTCHRVGFDVVWYDWSQAFSEMPITLRNPSNPVVGAVLGSEIRDTFPMNWHDSVSYRFGYEWAPTDAFTLRTGYVYQNSPVDETTLNPYLDGVLEHGLSFGFTRKVWAAEMNLAYQYSWSPTRTVGDSLIVGDDFDNSTMRADAHWIGASVLVPF